MVLSRRRIVRQKRFLRIKRKIVHPGLFIGAVLFFLSFALATTNVFAADELCVFELKKEKATDCPGGMEITVKELSRKPQVSIVRADVMKRGSYSGATVFITSCLVKITKARGYRYYVMLQENKKDCQNCEWSTEYVIGFVKSKTADIKKIFKKYIHSGNKNEVIDINMFSAISGILPVPSETLHLAIYRNDIKAVKRLVEENKKALNKLDNVYRPLHYAAADGFLEIIKLLVQAGADVDGKGKFGWAPLHLAVRFNKIETVKLLLQLKANPNVKMDFGNTPLHNAANRGDIGIAELLLEKGAGIHDTDFGGNTPLHSAAAMGEEEMVKFLLKKGADQKRINISGQTPLDVAKKKKKTKVIKILEGES